MTSIAMILAACGVGIVGFTVRAQENGQTVADSVYTDAQATRGAGAYDAACAGCHRADLGGGSGPALRGQRFAEGFAGKELKTLYTKIATTMPRGAPGTLGEDTYLDVVAHLLKENGFPAGSEDLRTHALDGIRVLPGRPKPPPPIGDFSYVEVVGCLTPGPHNTWTLTSASLPLVVRASAPLPLSSDTQGAALGTGTVHLLDAMAYTPERHNGHKMYVRGLLVKLPDERRMTVSVFEMVLPTCRE